MRYIQDGRIYLAGSEGEVPAGYFFNLPLSFKTHLARLYFTVLRYSRPMSVAKRTTSCFAILSFSQASSISLSARSLNLIPIGLTSFPLFSKYLMK